MDVICKIGEGPYFCQYKARRGTKFVVLKTPVRKETLYQELLRREYELGASLSHPSVVNTLGFEMDTPVGAALVMEYIEGESLEGFFALRPSDSRKRRVMEDILDAVEYLHKRGICHNDLKPSNIMVTREGHARIIDFGFSISDDSVYHGVRGGTEGFSAPEVLKGKGTAGVVSDIYSIGALLKYMSAAPAAVIRKCMSERPSGRYQSIHELRRSLAARRMLPIYMAVIAVAVSVVAGILLYLPASESEVVAGPEMSAASRNLETSYKEALKDMESVPCYEWATLVKSEFLEETVTYLDGLEYQQQLALGERFSEYVASLDSMMFSLPTIEMMPVEVRDSIRRRVEERCQDFL